MRERSGEIDKRAIKGEAPGKHRRRDDIANWPRHYMLQLEAKELWT
jgi:hypothetical protein